MTLRSWPLLRNLGALALFALLATTVAVLLLRPSRAVSEALARRAAATELLGREVARAHPGGDVLVLANPFARHASPREATVQFEQAALRGLRRGLGSSITVTVVWPEVPPEIAAHPESVALPPNTRTPLSFLIRPESVDTLAQAHPRARTLVSLIGLPAGVEKLAVWRDDPPRGFALLLPDLRVLGDPARALEAFERGRLLATVVEEPGSGTARLVTRDNAAKVLREQPGWLGF